MPQAGICPRVAEECSPFKIKSEGLNHGSVLIPGTAGGTMKKSPQSWPLGQRAWPYANTLISSCLGSSERREQGASLFSPVTGNSEHHTSPGESRTNGTHGVGASNAAMRTATSQDLDTRSHVLGIGSSPEICGKQGIPTPASLCSRTRVTHGRIWILQHF